MRRREITYYDMGETATSLSIEMEWFEAEKGVRHVLFQARVGSVGSGQQARRGLVWRVM